MLSWQKKYCLHVHKNEWILWFHHGCVDRYVVYFSRWMKTFYSHHKITLNSLVNIYKMNSIMGNMTVATSEEGTTNPSALLLLFFSFVYSVCFNYVFHVHFLFAMALSFSVNFLKFWSCLGIPVFTSKKSWKKTIRVLKIIDGVRTDRHIYNGWCKSDIIYFNLIKYQLKYLEIYKYKITFYSSGCTQILTLKRPIYGYSTVWLYQKLKYIAYVEFEINLKVNNTIHIWISLFYKYNRWENACGW